MVAGDSDAAGRAAAPGSAAAPGGAQDIERAVQLLRAGKLVAFPTETVYGLGGDAENAAAVRAIFAAKGRPADHPVIVHLRDASQIDAWARDVPPAARALAAAFWPGPLTLVLPRSDRAGDWVTGGQDTVGLRSPAHPLAQALLAAFGGALAAPSANRYGHVSPTDAAHVCEELGDAVAMVLDGGACPLGIESTIVGFIDGSPMLLRPGSISAAQIEAVAGPLAEANMKGLVRPRVPGSVARHYAPRTPAELVAAATLAARVAALVAGGQRIGVLALASPPPELTKQPAESLQWVACGTNAQEYARGLYRALRSLDARGLDCIVIEMPPLTAEWMAVRDRLGRAAQFPAGG